MMEYISDNIFWIARDRNENLYLYRKKPDKICDSFVDKDEFALELHPDLFPEVTFENSPQEFQLTPINL